MGGRVIAVVSPGRNHSKVHSIMRRAVSTAFATACSLVLLSSRAAAEVRLLWPPEGGSVVIIDGTITRETTFELALASIEIEARNGSHDRPVYALNSPGGVVSVAVHIASMMQEQNTLVAVFSGAECASACFLLFAAGREKLVSPGAVIGIHSARSGGAGEDWDALATTAVIAKLASAYGVPDDIVGKLVRTPPEDISTLTPEELGRVPGTEVRRSKMRHAQYEKNSEPVSEYWAGYGAGAYIAAGKSSDSSCQFDTPEFQRGCLAGLRDAPPDGWAWELFNKENNRR